MTDLTVVSDKPGYHCPRCELEYEPDVINIDPYCGRCAYDIGGTIDITDVPIDPDAEKRKAGQVGKADLMLMLENWSRAFIRVIDEKGVDWSSPHEYMQEVAEQMLPYIGRLKDEGYLTAEDVRELGDFFTEQLAAIIAKLEQEEDLMRLTGRWDDNEQEIKEYWQERLCKAHGAIPQLTRVSLPR
jgi:hypothetical protein